MTGRWVGGLLAGIVLSGAPVGAEAPEVRKVVEGRTFVFRDGKAYERVDGRETLFKILYDPAHVERCYRTRDGRVFARSEDGKEYPVLRSFSDG
nr:hypothetical protein [Elusimicrobiota bacterium]